eukprot:4103875-Prymnesium_polylepis.1
MFVLQERPTAIGDSPAKVQLSSVSACIPPQTPCAPTPDQAPTQQIQDADTPRRRGTCRRLERGVRELGHAVQPAHPHEEAQARRVKRAPQPSTTRTHAARRACHAATAPTHRKADCKMGVTLS